MTALNVTNALYRILHRVRICKQNGTHILFIFRSNVTTGLDRIEAVSNQSADKVNKLEDMVRNKPKKSKTMVPILDGIA